jgi:hypothetical protein
MPFDWYHTTLPKSLKASGAARRKAMYLEEVRSRASLMRRLGYSKEATLNRVKKNLEWGFELHERPAFIDLIPEVVDSVYNR